MTKPLLDGFDPTTIADPALRAVVQALMNQVETLHEQTRTQAAVTARCNIPKTARLKRRPVGGRPGGGAAASGGGAAHPCGPARAA